VWLSVPESCSDAAFFCQPWALVNEEGTLAVADELEEHYAVCSEGQVSIPVDSDDDDAEEDDVSERVVCASPIVTTEFLWIGRFDLQRSIQKFIQHYLLRYPKENNYCRTQLDRCLCKGVSSCNLEPRLIASLPLLLSVSAARM
jgi:hypothetical protein